MINDLSVANTSIWKYVDDTTLAECVEKNRTSSMQSRVEEFVTLEPLASNWTNRSARNLEYHSQSQRIL